MTRRVVLFYNEIIGNEYPFSHELLHWVKIIYRNVEVFDIDNLTDISILDSILSIVEQSDLTLIFAECNFQSSLFNLQPIMEQIWQNPDKYHLITRGGNTNLHKMARLCKNVYPNFTDVEQKGLVKVLFTNTGRG